VEFAPQQQQEKHQLGLDPVHISLDLSNCNKNAAESASFPMKAPDKEELLLKLEMRALAKYRIEKGTHTAASKEPGLGMFVSQLDENTITISNTCLE
jgi:hypothetical protein